MAKRPQQARARSADATVSTESHFAAPDWRSLWNHFLAMHRQWWRRVGGSGPVYALPSAVITALAHTSPAKNKHRTVKALISEQDAGAERHFASLCRAMYQTHGMVGVWDDEPIVYPLLREHVATFAIDEEVAGLWERNELITTKQLNRASRTTESLSHDEHSMLGYVGRITYMRPYRTALADVQRRWAALRPRPRDRDGMGWTLGPRAMGIPADTSNRQTPARREYHASLAQLRKVFFLREFRTWDLPVPWPPFGEVELMDVLFSLGRDTRVFLHPPYLPVPSELNIRNVVRRWQDRMGQAAGVPNLLPITDITPRGRRASEHETRFRLQFVEASIRQRYGDQRGTTARLQNAMSLLLRISVERLKRIKSNQPRQHRPLTPAH